MIYVAVVFQTFFHRNALQAHNIYIYIYTFHTYYNIIIRIRLVFSSLYPADNHKV